MDAPHTATRLPHKLLVYADYRLQEAAHSAVSGYNLSGSLSSYVGWVLLHSPLPRRTICNKKR